MHNLKNNCRGKRQQQEKLPNFDIQKNSKRVQTVRRQRKGKNNARHINDNHKNVKV